MNAPVAETIHAENKKSNIVVERTEGLRRFDIILQFILRVFLVQRSRKHTQQSSISFVDNTVKCQLESIHMFKMQRFCYSLHIVIKKQVTIFIYLIVNISGTAVMQSGNCNKVVYRFNDFKTRYLITFRKNFILFVVIRRMKGSIVERQNNKKVFKNL